MNFTQINKKSPQLSLKTYQHIYKIFKEKDWPDTGKMDEQWFNSFCSLLSEMTEDQCQMFLALTENFLWVQDGDYMDYFAKSFEIFISDHPSVNGITIYICPLLKDSDFQKTKSSKALFYNVRSRAHFLSKKYPDYTFSFVESPKLINPNALNGNNILCLIDDFIGTGETVESAVQYFTNKNISKNSIAIVSLVAMKQGIDSLSNKNICVYSDTICHKGIYDTYGNNPQYVALMQELEDKIKPKDDFQFGYKGSEALVKVMHTPNNTFPIYWQIENNPNAPFPR